MRLIHVQRLLKVSAKRGNEDLIDLVFHDKVGKPPALCALDAISAQESDRV
jgi:hypothetical protein